MKLQISPKAAYQDQHIRLNIFVHLQLSTSPSAAHGRVQQWCDFWNSVDQSISHAVICVPPL